MTIEITTEVAVLSSEIRSHLRLLGLTDFAVITDDTTRAYLTRTLEIGVVAGVVVTDSIKHVLTDYAIVLSSLAAGNVSKRVTLETGRIFGEATGSSILYSLTVEEAVLNDALLCNVVRQVTTDNGVCGSATLSYRFTQNSTTDVGSLGSSCHNAVKTAVTDVAVVVGVSTFLTNQCTTLLENAVVHGTSLNSVVFRSTIFEVGVVNSSIVPRSVTSRGSITDAAYITSYITSYFTVEAALTKTWSINVRNWYMGEYHDLPIKEMGSRYGVGPDGLYVRTPGSLAVASYFETGDINVVAGNDFNIHTIYLTLSAGRNITLRATSSEYGNETVVSYPVPTLTSVKERSRIVRLSRKVDGNAWKFRLGSTTGHWGITHMALELGRNRAPKK